VLGIVIGLVLGIATAAVFVFLGSEGTIDAPRISGVESAKPGAAPDPGPAAAPTGPRPTPTVRVVGGAPPPSGPARLHFKRGGKVRFRLVTDAPVAIAVPGYGVEETLESGQTLSFAATRVGQFPLVAAASEISLATLVISK
jgi:hypothetical protein